MQQYILYAIMSPIKEVVIIKKFFDWYFYKNDELIESYNNLEMIDNTYLVNENLKLIKDKGYILERINDDYKIVIDFKTKTCTINLTKEKMFMEINLLETEIVDKEDKLTIIYKLDDDEINKLIVNLKE